MKVTGLLLAAAIVLAGCSTKVETVRLDPKTWEVIGQGIRGVVYYEPMLVKLTYEFNQRVEEKAGFVGSADSDPPGCKRVVQKQEVVVLADFTSPRAVLHKPSIFSSTEFGAVLKNGMLESVNAKASPQTAANLEGLAKVGTAAAAMGGRSNGLRDCNAGPIITERVRFVVPEKTP